MESVTATPDATAAFSQRSGFGPQIQRALHRYPTLSPAAVLLIASIAFSIFSDGKFAKPATIGIILQQTAVMAALAIGQTLIVLTAGVDLAVGTGMLLTHLVIAKLFFDKGFPAPVALFAGGNHSPAGTRFS